MLEPIWQAVKDELSGQQARDFTARIWEHARWNSFDQMRQTADEIASIMREIGLQDVEVLEYPADGLTAYGGWVMPQAWDVEEATLEIVEPNVAQPILASYRECPQSLMMYSAPTRPEGVVAEVVAVDKAADAASYGGRDVQGRIVLVDGVGIDVGLHAFEHGAAGIVSDAMPLAGSPHEKTPGHFDDAVQWHNYTVPPWRTGQKGFGFSISPAAGRRLREPLARGQSVKLRAIAKTRLYHGTLPAITGLLRGETADEIAITGHAFEPGANDNASGCGLGLEVVRTIKALCEQGKLARLRRGVRPVFSFEVRGYQAFLATWPRLDHLVAGLNLDMVGNDLSEARARSNLVFTIPALPAYTDVLGVELLRRLQRDDPLFRFRAEPWALVDNLFGDPAVGAPTCVLGNWRDAYYHTSLDRIETLSPAAMAAFGRVAATYCALLANAGLAEAAWLARLTAAHAEGEVLDAAQRILDRGATPDAIGAELERVAERNAARLRSITRLVPSQAVKPTRSGLAEHAHWLCSWSHLFQDEDLREQTEELSKRLAVFARRAARAARADRRYARRAGALPRSRRRPAPEGPAPDQVERARRLVPLRTFKGSLCFESLDEAALRDLKDRTGLGVGWGAPGWLQLALFMSSGKRTAWDIWQWLKRESGPPDLARFCRTIEFLAEHGFVRLRPYLTGNDYLAAFDAAGVPGGGVLMVHPSLSQFGYVEGGADTVIDALLEALGPAGTLAMPTLSFSWAGRPLYDPAKTPSRVGAITDAFWRRPGVRRSPHPTHSVAAFGPKADEIVRDHTPDRPVFSDEGAYGRLCALDAHILMLAKLASNTSLHVAEERAGLLLTDMVGHVAEGRKRREVAVVHAPWHANFDEHYRALFERGLVRQAPLGESEIYLMRARDAVDVALGNVRRNPLLVTGGDACTCEFCRNIRAHLQAKGWSPGAVL